MLKVVCLHGWGISPKFMELQTKDLKKALPYLDMRYLEAPYDVPPGYIQDEKVIKYSPDNKFKSWKESLTEDLLVNKKVDFSKAVAKLVDFIKQNGGADGVLGFSLGGLVVQQFFEKLENGELDLDVRPKFAMFVSVNYDKYIPKLMTTPSVHVVGMPDDPLYGANVLNSTRFLNPLFIIHGEGHKFPKLSKLEIDQLHGFFKPIRAQVLKEQAETSNLQLHPKL